MILSDKTLGSNVTSLIKISISSLTFLLEPQIPLNQIHQRLLYLN